ncbi:DUF1080 domain-containing protein [Pedobacter hiemivivus]|uniref:DUF1080 domain-containing protein n=1 Tax=Pedobacter hiemivivus TaxID=2530454 RepID=UPI0021CECEA8|nr:DUF1080 domain-containing protein [Pedobacter hiemivivus]
MLQSNSGKKGSFLASISVYIVQFSSIFLELQDCYGFPSLAVIVMGPKIKVILNGTVILDADITEARKNGTVDGKKHPGLMRETGHIGFLGHGSEVQFKNIRIKDLGKKRHGRVE